MSYPVKFLSGISAFMCCFYPLIVHAQSFTLAVTNGYGSGSYHTGDTVHIWSAEYDSASTFDYWSGDVSLLESDKEWHTTFIMPSNNVSLTAHIRTMPTYQIYYEQIMGKNNLKNVYYYFPPNMKGIIYLLHGTGGSARGWIDKTEGRSFTNAAIADTFGIIVTEAEEITLNTDLNGDGKLRWSLSPFDSVANVDYANIKVLTDTFINRGWMTYSTPRFSFGMSNGGSYSSALSYLYHYRAGISYCASGTDILFQATSVPFAFRMALYDDNEEVGPEGNYQAWQHDSTLEARSICHDYLIHDRQPIYPERFARIPGVSVAVSQNIFNELVANGQLDAGYYALSSDSITAHILSSPSSYPVILSQPVNVLQDISNKIGAANAQHQFYSDLNHASLMFFNTLCNAPLNNVTENGLQQEYYELAPNPVADQLFILGATENPGELIICNTGGEVVYTTTNVNSVNVAGLPAGIYYLIIKRIDTVFVKKFIKV